MKKLLLTVLVLLGWSGICHAAITAVTSTANTGNSTTGANFTLTSPTGTTTGDVLVIIVSERQATDGVTRIDDNGGSGGHTFTNQNFGAQATTSSTSTWYHVVGASDGTTWTVTNTAKCQGAIMAYRGVDNTTPIDAAGTTNTATSTTATFAAVNTVTAGAWYIGVYGENIATGSNLTYSTGTPQPTVRTDTGNGGGTTAKQAASLIDTNVAAAGSSGTFTYTLSSQIWSTYSFALRPSIITHTNTIARNSTISRNSTIN